MHSHLIFYITNFQFNSHGKIFHVLVTNIISKKVLLNLKHINDLERAIIEFKMYFCMHYFIQNINYANLILAFLY